MTRTFATLALLGLLVASPGCGDKSNSVPANASSVDYAKQSQDKMAEMYGAPKPEKFKSNNASDLMRNYKPKP